MNDKFDANVYLVQASKLRVDDSFMEHLPKTDAERRLMVFLVESIAKNKIEDFYCFSQGSLWSDEGAIVGDTLIPATQNGVNYHDFERAAKALEPSKNSRIGAQKKYILMLGVLIKMLVNRGWKKEDAWDAICNNPKKILQSEESWPEILLLKNLLKAKWVMLDNDSDYEIAFYVVNTQESLYSFRSYEYQQSEYDAYIDTYFSDYTYPCTKSPFQDMLDGLSREAPDVKAETWKNAIAWIIMDVN